MRPDFLSTDLLELSRLLAQMEYEWSISKSTHNTLLEKRKRIEFFKSLHSKLSYLKYADHLIAVEKEINRLRAKDAEMNGIIIKIKFKDGAPKYGRIIIKSFGPLG